MLDKWTDKVNGFGVWFRFILPILMGLLIWNFNSKAEDLEEHIQELKHCHATFDREIKEIKETMDKYFSNHLSHHADFERGLEGRLSRMEVILEKKLR